MRIDLKLHQASPSTSGCEACESHETCERLLKSDHLFEGQKFILKVRIYNDQLQKQREISQVSEGQQFFLQVGYVTTLESIISF